MKKFVSRVAVFLLLLCLGLASSKKMYAQNHVVSTADLENDAAAATVSRQQNLAKLETSFSSERAQQALKSAHIDYQQVKTAISQLDNDELARFASRSEKAQKDFAAGTLADRDLLLILVAIAALILIIVAVR